MVEEVYLERKGARNLDRDLDPAIGGIK